jgi:hypothetical protein
MVLPQTPRLLLLLIPCLALLTYGGCGRSTPGPVDLTVVLDSGMNLAGEGSATGLLVIDRDPNIIWSNVKFGRGYATQDELVQRFLVAVAGHVVATGELVDGRALLCGLGSDKYWVVTAGLVRVRQERLLWSLPLPPTPTGSGRRELVLHRSNVALALGPRDIPLSK